ncbi:MAG: hypothetical protein AB4063_24050 [Crocosphaera sp.]
MSQTPITVTYSLEEVLGELKQGIQDINGKLDTVQQDLNTKIDNNQKEVNTKLETMQKDLTDLKVEMGEVKTELKGMNKRIDSQEFLNRSIAIGVIVALTSGVIKLFFPNFLNLPH